MKHMDGEVGNGRGVAVCEEDDVVGNGDEKERASCKHTESGESGRRSLELERMIPLKDESNKRVREKEGSNDGALLPLPLPAGCDGAATAAAMGILEAGGLVVGGSRGLRGYPCVSHGAVSVIGRRREMEDTVTLAPGWLKSLSGEAPQAYDYFGVYDGHGGARVAEACRERLHVVLAAEVGAWAWGGGGEQEEEQRWRAAMASCFAKMDREVSMEAGNADMTVGSTAVVAVVGARRIVVANCGDSRAVLLRGGIAMPLSKDHKPDEPEEMERVEAIGGRVINWDGHRILGVLATSRSIGDYYLKPYVSSEPDVTVIDRTEKDEFLILGSDGLWDVVTNESACRIVKQCLTGRAAKMFPESVCGRTSADAAAVLTEIAMARGSKDNISIVVVELKKLGSRVARRS